MKPSRTDDDALVDLLDVLLRDGVVVEADVILTVADVPLVGVKLRAAIAGMTTMTEYGMFEEWDRRRRSRSADGSESRSSAGTRAETGAPGEKAETGAPGQKRDREASADSGAEPDG